MSLFLIWALLLAAAGGGKTADFSELPTYDLATAEEIGKGFFNMKFAPLGDPQLRMSFLVDREWQPRPLSVSPERLARDSHSPVELVLVESADGKASISVAYLRLKKDIPLERWVEQYLAGNRLKVLLSQTGRFGKRQVVDVLTATEGGYRARLTFSRHRDLVIIMAGACEEKYYARFARNFGLAAVSLELADE